MKATLLTAIIVIAATLVHGAEKGPPDLTPDTFRFVRTEQKKSPPNAGIDQASITVTYGVFAFRYRRPQPLEFWGFGQAKGQKFTTRFTAYRILRNSAWEQIPLLDFCGTGLPPTPCSLA